MCAILKIVLVALCLSAVNSSAAPPHNADFSLMQFLVKSRSLQQVDPERTLQCFDYYVPELNAIAEKYKEEYKACLDAAEGKCDAIDASTQPKRDAIEASAEETCSSLQACSENVNSIDYFECYANTASDSSKKFYTISADSAELLADITEQYRQVDVVKYHCTNASERAYVEDTAATYEQLQECLLGTRPVPTPSTPEPEESSTPEPEESSTPEPEESSTPEPEESSTPEPEEPSTPEPEEPSTPEPEEPSTPEPEEPSTPEPEEPSTPEPEEPSTPEPEEPSTPEPEEPSTPEPEEPSTPEPEEPSTPEPEEPSTPGSEESTTEGSQEETTEDDSDKIDSNESLMPEEDIYRMSRNRVEKIMRDIRARMQQAAKY